MQSDFAIYDGDALDFFGEDEKLMNFTLVQPVLSTQLTEGWKMILRPTIPNYVEQPDSFGPEYQLRLIFSPVIPAPAWAKRPLVGG
jgi:hypothetical protein